MRKYIIDFVFNEMTGSSNIVVDFIDESMTSLEMNMGIRDGSLREDILNTVEKVFGEEISNGVRNGKIDMICLDDHPDERKEAVFKEEQQNDNNQEENTL